MHASTRRLTRTLALLAPLTATLAPLSAHAQACTEDVAARRYCGTDLIGSLGGAAGYGEAGQCLGPNDDGSSRAIDITSAFPGGLNFFGTTYRTVYLNTNGNITFNGPVGTYTPDAFPVSDQPMIAPYWADVDIRSSACDEYCDIDLTTFESDCLTSCANPVDNGVWYDLTPGRAVFTWDNVNYFSCHGDRQMSFQLILTAAEGCGGATSTDFSVEFRFNKCQWDTGDASSGTDGFSTPTSPAESCTTDADCTTYETHCEVAEGICYTGVPGQSGFDAGNSRDFVMVSGSRTNDITRRLCEDTNVDPADPASAPGVWRFLVRGGVVECPGAGEDCTVDGAQGVCAIGRTSCVGADIVCAPQFTSSAERCDNLDNDCDGMVDDGSTLCPDPQVCASGRCVDPCFEGGCLEGQTCTAAGVCVETACVDVTCPPGQRCEGGTCVEGCDGVTCPLGQTCIAGRCVDGCATITCDPTCEACDSGACVPRCTAGSCPAGEDCNSDGVCRSSRCGTGCPAGQVCGDTGCVDACTGVTCPAGEICSMGMCVTAPPPMIDAAVPMGEDSGLPPPDAFVVDFLADAGMDASTNRPPTRRGGCNCEVPARSADPSPLAWLSLAALGLAAARRRR
ncbi:MAG: MYXO-CTERM sorting domain-containing protein [Sandaracinus sp.]